MQQPLPKQGLGPARSGRRNVPLVQPVGSGSPSWKAVNNLWLEEKVSGTSHEEMPCVWPWAWGSSLSSLAHDQGQVTKGNRRRKPALSLWRVWVRFVWKETRWLRTGTHPPPGDFSSFSHSKSQLWTGLPAREENTCANSRCKEQDLSCYSSSLTWFVRRKHISKQFNTCIKTAFKCTHSHTITMCTYALLQTQLTVNLHPCLVVCYM